MSEYTSVIISIFCGLLLISSYIFCFRYLVKGFNYLRHPFWLSLPVWSIRIIVVFQLLAALGFIVAIIGWAYEPPKKCFLEPANIVVSVIVALLIISACVWPFATALKMHWATVISLIITAACSICLLIGACLEVNRRWWIITSLIFLCLITAGADGLMWNILYIQKAINKSLQW